jgi:predicted RNA binding protein YcfA (HicA-like mRNA interferase family)
LSRLSGFRYREVARRLKHLGFGFDRNAAGSHEIWYNAATGRYTTLVNHPGELPQGTLRAIISQAGVTVDEFLSAGKLTKPK